MPKVKRFLLRSLAEIIFTDRIQRRKQEATTIHNIRDNQKNYMY